MLTELEKLLDLLRSKGVTHMHLEPFDGKGFCGASILDVTIGPLDPPARPAEKDDPPVIDTETCRCGHALYAHINGLCGDGCDIMLCAPPERK